MATQLYTQVVREISTGRKLKNPVAPKPRRSCQEEFCTSYPDVGDLCTKHYFSRKREGQPRQKYRGRMKALMDSISQGALPDECIRVDWTKTRPKYIVAGVGMCASRAAWILRFGDPGELWVLHRCHDDRCINPKHLYLSTPQQNIRDMDEAGRRVTHSKGGRRKDL